MINKKQMTVLAAFALTSIAAATAQANTVVGAAVGAAVGSAIGQQANGRDGAVIGGAIGGAIGAGVGHDMERGDSQQGEREREVVYEEREVHHHHDHYYYQPRHHHPRGHAYGYYKRRPVIFYPDHYGSSRYAEHRWNGRR